MLTSAFGLYPPGTGDHSSVDVERHRLTYAYASARGAYSAGRHNEHWVRGYQRFGDRFEEALYGVDLSDTRDADLDIEQNLEDPWNLIGLDAASEIPHIGLLWPNAGSRQRVALVDKVAQLGVPHSRYDEVLTWSQQNRLPYLMLELRGWVGPILGAQMGDWTVDGLLTLIDAGCSYSDVMVLANDRGLHGYDAVHAVLLEGVPLEYARLV